MNTRVTFDEALRQLPTAGGGWDVVVGRRGSMLLELYTPQVNDPQRPHNQDELYVVQRGHGTFVRGDEQVPFAPGDVLFVEAGVSHRFENFSADFATWVIFWGTAGGEQPLPQALDEGENPPLTSELSRNALIWRTRSAYCALNTFLDGLSDEQGNRLTDAQGWAIKDHVAHLVPWMQGMISLLNDGNKLSGMGVSAELYAKGFDQVNEMLFERHKHRSLNDARWLFQQTYEAFMNMLMVLPKVAVMRPYKSFDSASSKTDPVIFWLWGNSGGHIFEHLPWMQAIVREQRPA